MTTSIQGTLKTQKRALRKATSATLALLSASSVEEQSKKITDRVLSLPAFNRCKTISCYLSMPTGEVETSSLVSSILCQPGRKLFVPKIQNKDGIMDFLEIFGPEDLDSLPSGTWGIKEPDDHWQGKVREHALNRESDALDMILMPGVAFDRSLSRLGHGKGYYDRFISTYTSGGRRRPLLVGLTLREQLLAYGEIPIGDLDWKLDLIITPDETLGNFGELEIAQ